MVFIDRSGGLSRTCCHIDFGLRKLSAAKVGDVGATLGATFLAEFAVSSEIL
jgi:hypothetical protein